MKLFLGYDSTDLSKKVIAKHMANFLAARVFMQTGTDFAKAFTDYNKFCLMFLDQNPDFVYYPDIPETWADVIEAFTKKIRELLIQKVSVTFADGVQWTIPFYEIAMLFKEKTNSEKTVYTILEDTEYLIRWAEQNLKWSDMQEYAVLESVADNSCEYDDQWRYANKKIIKYKISD